MEHAHAPGFARFGIGERSRLPNAGRVRACTLASLWHSALVNLGGTRALVGIACMADGECLTNSILSS